MKLIKIILFLFIINIFPTYAWASGGGPIILLFNGSVFIIGQIWIMGIEFLIYRKFIAASKQEALGDIISANIFSTAVVSFGISSLIAIGGLLGSFLPGNIGKIISAIGTWVLEGAEYNTFAIYMALIWFVILFVTTVFFEAYFFKSRWRKRGFNSGINPITLCWYTNTISYIGLFIAILLIWRELIFP